MQTSTESARIASLRRYDILDTPPDGAFDRLTKLAAKIFNMPIAIISLVDEDRIWFKSTAGLDVTEIGRDPGLCSSAVLTDEVYVVENARTDARTLANPLVAGEFGLQFYAAAPLKTSDGHRLGTFCLIDKKERYLNEEQKIMLEDLAAIVIDELEIRLEARKKFKEAQDVLVALEQENSKLKMLEKAE